MARIGWLDSCRMPSAVHISIDKGESTLCGYPARRNHLSGRWVITQVPMKPRGRSAKCRRCFELALAQGHDTKTWIEPSRFEAVKT